MTTTLFIPVRNEIEAIKIIMPQIRKEWVDEIIIVDGNSTDGTREYFEERGYRVIRQRSKGIAGAYWECLEAAGGDIIIAFSPDGNSLSELIPSLRDKMKEGYDMVIASRYLSGAKSFDDDLITAFGNLMFTKLANIFFGAHYTDCLVMFRAFRKDLVSRTKLKRHLIPVFEYQLCIRCAKKKLKVTEIPADEPLRIGGVRKMKPFLNGSGLLYVLVQELFAKFKTGGGI